MHTRRLAVRALARACGSLIAVASVACSSNGSATKDPPPTSPADAALDADPPASDDAGATPSPGNCYPTPNDTGNSKNVGAFCTKNGGQCSNYPSTSLQCSSDLSAQGGDFCLLVGCTHDSDCGEDSCCTAPAGSPISACIPIGCFDSGVCSPVAP